MREHLSTCLTNIRSLSEEDGYRTSPLRAYPITGSFRDTAANQDREKNLQRSFSAPADSQTSTTKPGSRVCRLPSPQSECSSSLPMENAASITSEVPELDEHSSLQCEVVCSYCEQRQRFDSVMDHMQNHCPKRPIPCVFCKAYVSASKKPAHEASCNQRPGTCPHCKTRFKTMVELEQKHYPECLQMPVNCSFQEMGCTFEASRGEMAEHERNGNHANLIVQETARLKMEIKTLKKSIQGLSKLMAQEKQKRDSAASSLPGTPEALRKIPHHHFGLVEPTFQHTWTLYPFTHLKRATAAGHQRTISSGVLSVNTPGYRIELVVDLNGENQQWKMLGSSSLNACSYPPAYLSLNFRIHPGEHDDLLPWPFANKIRIVLVNHANEDRSLEFDLDPTTTDSPAECFKKPSSGRPNAMFGCARIIPIRSLEDESSEFVSHNSIVFKFAVLPV